MARRPSSLVRHQFEPTSFLDLTKCFVCDGLLENEMLSKGLEMTPGMLKSRLPEGLVSALVPKGRGCTCKVCGLNVHLECERSVRSLCAVVTHTFELRSYPPFSKMCYACGTTMLGLFNQGYRCSACGIDCHPGCRTNNNVRVCEAAPPDSSRQRGDEAEAEDVSEAAGGAGSVAVGGGGGRRSSWRKSLGKRLSGALGKSPSSAAAEPSSSQASQASRASLASPASLTSSSSQASAAAPAASSSDAPQAPPSGKGARGRRSAVPVQIPDSLADIGRELRKVHAQARAVALTAAVRWEQEEQPSLKVSRVDLTKHKTRLRAARDALAKKADKRARKRAAHYRAFAIKLLTSKEGKRKKAEAERIADELVREYSLHQCRERELLEELRGLVRGQSKAIDAELRDGPCRPDGALEQSLEQLEQLREQVQVATQSLEAVRRELFFPRWRHWFARLGLEGTYVGIGTVWPELVQGSCAVRVTLLPGGGGGIGLGLGKGSGRPVPTLAIRLGGFDDSYDFDEMGVKAWEPHKGAAGSRLVARVERLSVSGSALPVSFTLDQLSLDLEFHLNIEMQYFESRKRGIAGEWRLKPNSFLLAFRRFDLHFSGGSLNVPDSLLRSVVKNLLATGAKQAVKLALPPELGDYLLHVHERAPASMKQQQQQQQQRGGAAAAASSSDQVRFHARLDVASEVDHETLDYVFPAAGAAAAAAAAASSKTASTLVKLGKGLVKGAVEVAKLAAGGAGGDGALRREFKSIPLEARVSSALGLSAAQIELLVRTQQELGLSREALFPDETVAELGLKALGGGGAGAAMQGAGEAATQLGIKLASGDFASSTVPLRSVLDVVRYVLGYFGPDSKASVHTPRLLALWQGALDRMLALGGTDNSNNSSGSGSGSEPGSASSKGGRRVVFTDLIAQVLRLTRKRAVTHVDVQSVQVTFAAERLLRVARDKALSAVRKTRGGNAMVFQLRSTQSRLAAGAEAEVEAGELADDSLGLEVDASAVEREASREPSQLDDGKPDEEDKADAQDQEVAALLALRDTTQGLAGPGARQRAKEEQIKRTHELQAARIRYVRDKLLTQLVFAVDMSAGQGRYSLGVNDFDLLSPVDFQFVLVSSVFGNRSRINNWPWRRVMRSEGAERMHLAMVRVLKFSNGAPGSEVYASPDSPDDSLHAEFSQIHSRILSEAPLDKGAQVMTINMDPGAKLPDAKSAQPSWVEPGKFSLHWQGPSTLRFAAKMDSMHLHGSLPALQDFASDMLNWSLRNATNHKLERALQAALRVLIRYGRLNSFFGAIAAHVQAAAVDDDLFVSFANHAANGKKPLTMQVESNFEDAVNDLITILESYLTDPVDGGRALKQP